MWRSARAAAWLYLIGSWPDPRSLAVAEGSDEPIPDKVGAQIHLTKQERSSLKKLDCRMCKAILSEMHIEVAKHKMTQKGVGAESQVWETSNAMCLALLKGWKLDLPRLKLERKDPEEEDDMEAMMASGMDPQAAMRQMLVLKQGCSQWLEDFGGDTSGYIFKAVRDGALGAEEAAKDFCENHANLCGAGKKEKKRKQKAEKERMKQREAMLRAASLEEKERTDNDPFKSLPPESKFGLQMMMEQARDDPFMYMEDDKKERVRKAQADLRCDVCRTILLEAHAEVAKRPKSLQHEGDILPIVEGMCDGGKDLSLPEYFGVEPPRLPPAWTDRYRPKLQKETSSWALRPFKKGQKARQRWRELTVTGQQKPPPPTEAEGDMMLTLACKDVLEVERMAEALYEQMAACSKAPSAGCSAAAAAARAICRLPDGQQCPVPEGESRREL